LKIGILGWDHGIMGADGPFGEYDPDGPALVRHGRLRGHEMTLCTLEEISYVPDETGIDVMFGAEQARSFDAIISRAKLYGDDWRDRVERLTMLSKVPGVAMFDPVEVWTTGYSKFLMAQRLAAAGLPVPPCRSATTPEQVRAAVRQWGDVIVKPSYGRRSVDVERITDCEAEADMVAGLLRTHGTLLCQPFYPTWHGEYRLQVAGELVPSCMYKLPGLGEWHLNAPGASYERCDPPPELAELGLRAARTLGITLGALDVLPVDGGYVILEVNPIPAFLGFLGEDVHRATFDGVYDWVEKHAEEQSRH